MSIVNLYVYTNIRTTTPKDGQGIYVLEYISGGKTSTLTNIIPLSGANMNEGELNTLIAGMQKLTRPVDLNIFCDSKYVQSRINSIQTDILSDFKKQNGKEVKYSQEWRKIAALRGSGQLTAKCEKSHSYRKWMENELKTAH